MKLPLRRRRSASRGQALVEFAMILPVLALLVMLALDFGRVFFGWVGMSNAARIAANYAAAHPDAWNGGSNAAMLQAQYKQQTTNDLKAINCDPVGHSGSWLTSDIPSPTFKNVSPTDPSSVYENGDHVVVTLSCRFSFLTPLVGNILGSQLTIRSTAEFAVRGAEINGIPIGGGGCAGATVPNMVGGTVSQARILWTAAGFLATNFNPVSGSDTDLVTAQVTSPLAVPGDCIATNSTVTVTHIPSTTTCTMPQLIGQRVNAALTAYTTAGFTGTFTVNRPPNGNYSVTSQSLVGGSVYPCTTGVTVGGN